jgi:hypothetical protein
LLKTSLKNLNKPIVHILCPDCTNEIFDRCFRHSIEFGYENMRGKQKKKIDKLVRRLRIKLRKFKNVKS